MRRLMAVLILSLLLLPYARADSPVIWKKGVCTGTEFQKTVESVYLENNTAYAGCGYISYVTAPKLNTTIIWYGGNISAFSLNGTELWERPVGFVRKLSSTGKTLVVGVDISRGPSNFFGTLGKVWLVSRNGSILAGNITYGSFFDFDIEGKALYVADGWWIGEGAKNETWGRVYRWDIDGDKIRQEWFVELNGTIGRVRVGDVIYAGAGAPSGYTMKYNFGYLYGISKDGKLLWKLDTRWWVRDMETWRGNVVVGTGFDNVAGELYLIDKNGNIKWKKDLFYVEDIEIVNDTGYIAGIEGTSGKLVAVDLNTGDTLWEVSLPYRGKVVKAYNEYLLVGTGKFEQKEEGNRTMVYSEGKVYLISREDGKILNELDTGYVRSISINGDMALLGTGSGEVYLLDLTEFLPSKQSICGPGILVLLGLIVLMLRRN
ncbi:hypothetical protein A3L12_07515 [Thermococcus sp. P6]|uniref:outer membrane protein assembly factor BamB family protein n=1 Tax=Thermococcus sp. P6 TaxID=122420 RepID=UPI000B59E5C9|nr:PQQ-binding-like beta-propeller repeat protein [Thermococcus sp. P6]ASJ11153.1 hypothetical protein A3L12_07515 [Thermococcus sp. P6]